MPRLIPCLAAVAMCAFAQLPRGELRLDVRDSTGHALAATVDLASEINQLHRTGATDANGRYAAQNLGFGVYTVRVSRDGFQPWSRLVRVDSEIPVSLAVTLDVAPIRT